MKIFLVCTSVLTLVACSTLENTTSASAVLTSTQNSNVSGLVTFRQKNKAVQVTVEVKGLVPNSEHGFHVHEKGDCSSGDGMSAGGHFNPDNASHGAHTNPQHHVGDLPSLKADAQGNVKLSFESSSISLLDGASNIVGRGLIVHRDPDDFKTQPTGNSGPRLSCGVIVKS